MTLRQESLRLAVPRALYPVVFPYRSFRPTPGFRWLDRALTGSTQLIPQQKSNGGQFSRNYAVRSSSPARRLLTKMPYLQAMMSLLYIVLSAGLSTFLDRDRCDLRSRSNPTYW